MPQIAIGSTVVPIQNPVNGPGINGINAGSNPIYVGPDATVNPQSASQTLQEGDVLNWPANESLFVVCDPGKVSIFQYSNNGATITKGTVNTNILSGTVEIGGDVTLSGPVELATGSTVGIDGAVTVEGNVGIAGDINLAAGATVDATIINPTIDVAGGIDILSTKLGLDLLNITATQTIGTTQVVLYQNTTAMDFYQSLIFEIQFSGVPIINPALCYVEIAWGTAFGSYTFSEEYYLRGNGYIVTEVKSAWVKATIKCLNGTNVFNGGTQASLNQCFIYGSAIALPPTFMASTVSANPGPNCTLQSPGFYPWFSFIQSSAFILSPTSNSFSFFYSPGGSYRLWIPAIKGICTIQFNCFGAGGNASIDLHIANASLKYQNLGINSEFSMYEQVYKYNAATTAFLSGSFAMGNAPYFIDFFYNSGLSSAVLANVVLSYQPS